jgi:hypothetical protein
MDPDPNPPKSNPPKMLQRSIRITRRLDGRKVHFYPKNGSERNGKVTLDGHYKCPTTKKYKKTTRVVTPKTARKLGFAV